jgi:hypothetical protein
MSTLTILYKRILANASKVLNLPAIEDETQVRYSEISDSILTLKCYVLETCRGLPARPSNLTQTYHRTLNIQP